MVAPVRGSRVAVTSTAATSPRVGECSIGETGSTRRTSPRGAGRSARRGGRQSAATPRCRARCESLDTSADDTGGNGAAAQLWDCQSYALDQHWVHTSTNRRTTLARCLDIAGNSTGNNALVELCDCNTAVGRQVWVRQSDGSLLNPQSGRCKDATDGATADGTRLQIHDGNGTAAQKFALS